MGQPSSNQGCSYRTTTLTLHYNDLSRSTIIECEGPNEKSKQLLKHLFSNEKDKTPLGELFQNDEWKKYRYKIKLKITGTSYEIQEGHVKLRRTLSQTQTEGIEASQRLNTWITTGSFSFLHMVIIAQNIRILKYLINNQKGEESEFIKTQIIND